MLPLREFVTRSLAAFFCLLCYGPAHAGEIPLDKIRLLPGFKISIYARARGARSMALSPSGILYVGTREEGNVYAILPDNTRQKGGNVLLVAHGLNMPNGVAFRDGA